MARRRYRRYYRKRGKWCSNIFEMKTTEIQAPKATIFYGDYTIAENPAQTNTGVSQSYTVKNIEFSYYIDKDNATSVEHIEDVAIYIMFVPQGMTVTATYNLEHPEYVLAWKLIGSPTVDYDNSAAIGQQYQPRKITTRLSRRLDTGDRLIIFIKGANTSATYDTLFHLHGVVRWWTKAN